MQIMVTSMMQFLVTKQEMQSLVTNKDAKIDDKNQEMQSLVTDKDASLGYIMQSLVTR